MASDFGAHVEEAGLRLGLAPGERTEDGELSLGETVCLGFCHTASAVREGDLVDAGPDVVDRLAAGACTQAAEPGGASMLEEPVLLAPGSWAGLERALADGAERLLEEVKAANLRGRGGAGFPAGTKWEFAAKAPGDERVIVVNADEGDPGSYIDKLLMERSPDLLLEGTALAGLRGRRLARLHLRALGVPALGADPDGGRGAGAQGRPPRRELLGSDFSFDDRRSSRAPAPTWSARRRRC